MNAIEKRAREILAAQYPGDCGYETREWIMEGKYGDDQAISAIIAALTPPDGYVLVQITDAERLCNHVTHSPSSAISARRVQACIRIARSKK